MTATPVCQWCQQPAQPPVTGWDGQPECGDRCRCAARIASPAETEERP